MEGPVTFKGTWIFTPDSVPVPPEEPIDEPEEPVEEPEEPKTGDSSNLYIWLVLAAVSGLSLTGAGFVYYSKKRTR